ncbi:hypothetical protein P7H06_03980 [Paenibacillus larvae]|nr:hypothetical protein [Paenibacillus larvae]MDT2258891.1 hypothetical protein [Paenibacillus larvae]
MAGPGWGAVRHFADEPGLRRPRILDHAAAGLFSQRGCRRVPMRVPALIPGDKGGSCMIIFRSYQAGAERQLVPLWNQTMQADPVTPERFRNLVLLDANFDPLGLRIAADGERIIGQYMRSGAFCLCTGLNWNQKMAGFLFLYGLNKPEYRSGELTPVK